MKKKENQRVVLTKRMLKDALLRLMAEKSLPNITVSELCDTAGINRSTFYNHYSCPADVITEIEQSVIDDLDELWVKENAAQNWPLNKRVEALCSYLLEHKEVAKLLLRNNDTNSGFASLLINAAHVRATYEQVFACIKNPDSKRLMITFLTNGTYHMIRQWILEDVPMTPKEMGELVYLVATLDWEMPAGLKTTKSK